MDGALVLAGLALGVAASPHCVMMCSAPCAALTGGCRSSGVGFQLGRLLSYMAGGAVAAASVSALGAWSQTMPALRPAWTLLHLAFFGLGLWWLLTGRSPSWMQRTGVAPVVFAHPVLRRRPVRAGLVGLAWVAWPCAALQSALLLSALASSPQGGALVMGAFAMASLPALTVAPWAWARWRSLRGPAAAAHWATVGGLRLPGLCLMASSGWALTHGIWQRLAAWCA